MKIHVNRDHAGWIVDDICEDYRKHTRHEFSGPKEADVCWALSMWDVEAMARKASGKIITTIHHIDESKLGSYTEAFNLINDRSDAVIVPNIHTLQQISGKIKVPIHRIPYWLLSKRMPVSNPIRVHEFRVELLGDAEMLIGSFQKDSDTGTNKPKLCKGPDVFCDIVERIHKEHAKVNVVLTGYARRYIQEELTKRDIPFICIPRADNINELYDCLDWYFVTSRFEGGPQAVMEAAYRKVKILSTDVGIASGALDHACLCGSVDEFVQKVRNNVDCTLRNFEIVSENYTVKNMIPRYDALFEEVANA